MRKHSRFIICAVLAGAALLSASCDDKNNSTLSALRMPGEMYLASRCTIGGQLEEKSELECKAEGGIFEQFLYAVNQSTASVAYIEYYPKSSDFEAVDITTSVPGVTSIAVGDRPQSISGDPLGVFVVLTSAINDEISILSISDFQEIAYQRLDKKPVKITYHKDGFYVFFYDGTVRRLTIDFDCGSGPGVFTALCSLSKDDIDVSWENVMTLDGTPVDFEANPIENTGYVSYSDRRYVSEIGFDESAGECLSGSTYPCEIDRIGAGFGCSDGIDNDGDGRIDSEDESCFYPWSAEGDATDPESGAVGYIGVGECNDGIDNDFDGIYDALDPKCTSPYDASESLEGFQPMVYGTCSDGSDNDGDGDSDRADIKCAWPTNDEDPETGIMSYSIGLCRDGIDNNQNGLTDTEDNACYGPNGLSEIPLASSGRGQIAVDPLGRWLYVLDPVDSQLIVIDLETKQTIDRSGWFPRNRVVGIPVSRLALDVVADVRSERLYHSGTTEVWAERAIAFVSSSNGYATEFTIHQELTQLNDDIITASAEELVMLPTDTDTDESYIGVVRCIGRICNEPDLPIITLRQRNAYAYFSDLGIISNTYIEGIPYTTAHDAIISPETWRITYEGTLENEKRTDGYFTVDGQFHTSINLCTIGARPGDHLVLRNRKGVVAASLPQCLPFQQNADGSEPNLEWTITDVGANSLTIAPTGNAGDTTALPNTDCFTTGLDFEIRASGEWLITSKSTYVNRRLTVGTKCIDNPLNSYGFTRFKFDAYNPDDLLAPTNTQTAFFSVKMPTIQHTYARGDAFEFTTKSGQSTLSVGVGSAPTDMLLFQNEKDHYLMISESSANTIVVYDIDEEAVDDTL